MYVQRFQKDAIYRQMQEYKREKQTLEQQMKEVRRKARYHDQHLRTIDQWLKQLVDEIKVIIKVEGDEPLELAAMPSSLLSADQETFEEHLGGFSQEIRALLNAIFTKGRQSTPEIAKLQQKLSKVLAAEKERIIELEQAIAEKEEYETRLENASLRYMMAEKKLDRAKSATVAKLEAQARSNAQRPPDDGSEVKKEEPETNGVAANAEDTLELEKEINRLAAISEKLKEQIERLEEENSALSSQLTEASKKSALLTDDDYAKTELFKQLKLQCEDFVKKVNHLEASNTQLKEEAAKMENERTDYKTELEKESQASISEKDFQLGQAEANLSRIRDSRDALLADQAEKKARLEQDRTSLEKAKDLAEAQQARISALESENKRVTGNLMNEVTAEGKSLNNEQLRTSFSALSQKYDLLNKELESMSTAFSKTSKLAAQKVNEYTALEEKVVRLSAEKAKADQKYFAAMKNKETREGELRTLRLQNTKSTELFSQLKDAEGASRELISTLEKQLVESKAALSAKINEQRLTQDRISLSTFEISQLTTQLTDVKGLLTAKDSDMKALSSSCRTLEQEAEGMKASLADTKKGLESWRLKGSANASEQLENLRVSPCLFLTPMTNAYTRKSLIATSVGKISRIPSSRLAVTLFVAPASKSA